MGFGKVVIISSEVGCAEDVVKIGKSGFIFEARNVSALLSCLKQVFSSSKNIPGLGSRSKEIIKSYSVAETVNGVLTTMKLDEDNYV